MEPGFDSRALEVWRGQSLERIRRRRDNPSSLAFAEFNRLMYGDHPVGWVLDELDLSVERVSVAALQELHELLMCRDRLLVGISGDLTWEQAEPMVRAFLDPWPECSAGLTLPPEPDLRREQALFLLPQEIDQSIVIMAQPGGIRQEDSPAFFAARIANHILGAGGFTSRIMSRVRTEQGLAYGASSVWTTPIRYEGILGALTATSAETTVEAVELLVEILREFRDSPPSDEDVRSALEEIANGYVFAFESPAQIVSRQMLYRAQGLPDGWLARYLEGLGEVTAESVAAVVAENLAPDRLTILVVGDPARFEIGSDPFGPVFEFLPDGSTRPWVSPLGGPGGSQQSPP